MDMFQKKMSLSCFQVETASDQYLQTMQTFEAFLVFTDEDLNIVFNLHLHVSSHYIVRQQTNLKSNSRTDPSEPTEANKSRPLPALVNAKS